MILDDSEEERLYRLLKKVGIFAAEALQKKEIEK